MSPEQMRAEPLEQPSPKPSPEENVSAKSRGVLFILCLLLPFVGLAGVHRFYVGKIGTGLIWLLTWGLLGVGQFIDLIMILTGGFTDKEGKPVRKW